MKNFLLAALIRGCAIAGLLLLAPSTFAQCSLTATQLKADVMRFLAETYPGKVIDAGKSDDVVWIDKREFGLPNLRSKICTAGAADAPAERKTIMAEHFATVMSLMNLDKKESQTGWDEAHKRVILQLMPEEYLRRLTAGDKMVVWRPFVAGLLQATVLDSDKGYMYVNQAMLTRWGVSEADLFDQAKRNLDALTLDVHAGVGGEPGKVLYYGSRDGYDAARIMAPGVCQTAARTLGEPFYAGLPNRDFLIMWSTTLSSKMQDGMRQKLKADNAAYDHPMTAKVLRVWGDCRVEVAE